MGISSTSKRKTKTEPAPSTIPSETVVVLLWYETAQPTTLVGKKLQQPPHSIPVVSEFIAIARPPEQVYDLIWAFQDDFERLKDRGWVPADAKLTSYDFLLESPHFDPIDLATI